VIRARVTFGPPGCGKTTRLLGLFGEELARGTPPERTAVVTFTRAATREARGRLERQYRLSKEAMRWVCTIHSAAYRLLELKPDKVLSDERWKEFAERHHFHLTRLDAGKEDDALQEPPRRTKDDELRYVYEWGWSRRLIAEQALGKCPLVIPASAYRLFVRRLEEFKREHGLVGFADMLEDVLADELRPDVDVAFIDEAQDLSPLQIAVVEAWFGSCERVYVCGDDDQAVYGFQAADPGWLLELSRSCPTEVLTQSRRVPIAVHLLAERLIAQNKRRVPKIYQPTEHLGKVELLELEDAIELVTGEQETFVLARNRMYLRRVASELVQRGVAFRVEGGGARSPLFDARLRDAVRAACELMTPEYTAVPARGLDDLLRYVPSGRLAPRGVKTKVRGAKEAQRSLSRQDLVVELGLAGLLDALDRGGPLSVFLKIPERDRRYLQALLARFGEIPNPKVVLTSIHGSKGREAELVVVLSDMTRSTFAEYRNGGPEGFEAENRVFYVAVTRAQQRLVLVKARGRRYYEFPRLPYQEGVL
jgi:DNA helicase-2/ATP-dependent DNA helicase PcrA